MHHQLSNSNCLFKIKFVRIHLQFTQSILLLILLILLYLWKYIEKMVWTSVIINSIIGILKVLFLFEIKMPNLIFFFKKVSMYNHRLRLACSWFCNRSRLTLVPFLLPFSGVVNSSLSSLCFSLWRSGWALKVSGRHFKVWKKEKKNILFKKKIEKNNSYI